MRGDQQCSWKRRVSGVQLSPSPESQNLGRGGCLEIYREQASVGIVPVGSVENQARRSATEVVYSAGDSEYT